MCLTSPMSFPACLGGQKLSKYAQHKYRKEDSGELSEHRKSGSLRLFRRKSAGRVSSFNTVQTHVYIQERIPGIGGERPPSRRISSRFSSAARRQQLKHRNCRSPSFEHPLPPSHYRYSPSEKFLGPGNDL